VTKSLTLAVDFHGRRVIDGQRLVADTFAALDGSRHSQTSISRKGPSTWSTGPSASSSTRPETCSST
jgi:hypothetical protein